MEKQIDKLLRQLKMEMGIAAIIVVAMFVLGECDIIPNGVVPPKSRMEFYLTVVVVGMTLVGIPLSLKLFTLNTTRGLRRMNYDEALQSYHGWSIVRLGLLVLTATFGIFVYYITLNTSPVFCVIAALAIASYYCHPSKEKITNYLESRTEI